MNSKNKAPDLSRIDKIDDEMAEVIRGKSGAERLKIASDMYASARRMLISHLRSEHPDWDEEQINREAAHRLSHGAVQPPSLREHLQAAGELPSE